jgi:hypothetical protein
MTSLEFLEIAPMGDGCEAGDEPSVESLTL